jgi:hypothetical protein
MHRENVLVLLARSDSFNRQFNGETHRVFRWPPVLCQSGRQSNRSHAGFWLYSEYETLLVSGAFKHYPPCRSSQGNPEN